MGAELLKPPLEQSGDGVGRTAQVCADLSFGLAPVGWQVPVSLQERLLNDVRGIFFRPQPGTELNLRQQPRSLRKRSKSGGEGFVMNRP